MNVVPSLVPRVEITAHGDFTVAVRNVAELPIAFLGVRFDLVKANGKPAASMLYADMLRYPERADFLPGTVRIVSIEHGVTEAMRLGIALQEMPDYQRIAMNLATIRTMLSITASLDCVAFTDGRFCGPDLGGAFERLTEERAAEIEFLAIAKAEIDSALEAPPKRFAHLKDLSPQARAEALKNHRLRLELTQDTRCYINTASTRTGPCL